jgi:hypothetical protein
MARYFVRPVQATGLALLLCANQSADGGKVAGETDTLPFLSQNAALVEAETNVTPEPIVLPFNTPVTVMLDEELSSKIAKSGDEFSVTVLDDVRIGETVIIPSGTQGLGEVRFANDRGGFGRAGLLDVSLRYIDLGDHKLPLRGRFRQEGKNNNGATVATWIAVGVFSGFIKGKEGVLLKGQQLKGRTASDYTFVPNSFAASNEPSPKATLLTSGDHEALGIQEASLASDPLKASETEEESVDAISDDPSHNEGLTTEGKNNDE